MPALNSNVPATVVATYACEHCGAVSKFAALDTHVVVKDPPAALIQIIIDEQGRTRIESELGGRWKTKTVWLNDKRLLEFALPQILAELRAELQVSAGSIVTS
jgi:hypothetical protein